MEDQELDRATELLRREPEAWLSFDESTREQIKDRARRHLFLMDLMHKMVHEQHWCWAPPVKYDMVYNTGPVVWKHGHVSSQTMGDEGFS